MTKRLQTEFMQKDSEVSAETYENMLGTLPPRIMTSNILNRKEAELDVKVSEKTKSLTDTVAYLKLENGTMKKEVEILTQAFKNLGFDVKDMKEILNKLVDGIVSKNSIQLVK